jgi:ketosteroid isomerase-like protein
VLSEDTLRRMGDIDRDMIEERVRRVYDCWARGDVETLIDYLAPDVVFPANGFWTGMTSPLRGRDLAAKAMRQWAEGFENIVSVLHEIVIDGDRVVVHRTAVGRVRYSGRRYQCDAIAFFRFRDGLIVEYSDYPDAAAWSKVLLDAA